MTFDTVKNMQSSAATILASLPPRPLTYADLQPRGLSFAGLAKIYGTSTYIIKRWLGGGWTPWQEQPGSEQYWSLYGQARQDYFMNILDRIEQRVGEARAERYAKLLNEIYMIYVRMEQLLEDYNMDDLKSTADIRTLLSSTLKGLDNGTTSTSIARIKVQAARAFLDTLKVELAAASFGKEAPAVTFSPPPQLIEHKKDENT